MFDGNQIKAKDLFHRPLGQIWIFVALETPFYLGQHLGKQWSRAPWVSSFNWTITHDRSNGDIFFPYDEIREKNEKDFVTLNFTEIFNRKNKTALIVHSHCRTQSKRNEYLSILQKYLDVDSLGACGRPWKCGRRHFHDDCFEIINSYKFYLAFENSICNYYFTEKLYQNFDYNSIMVVRGGFRENRNQSVPDGTYISTDDFKSIKSLADYLVKVSNSESLYTELLKKKSLYQSVSHKTVCHRAMCNLCERMNKQDHYRKTIPNISDWVYGGMHCRPPLDLIET